MPIKKKRYPLVQFGIFALPVRKYVLIVILSLLTGSMPAYSQESLQLLIWESYVSPEVLEAFETETGIQVETTLFSNDEQRSLILSSAPGRYDLIQLDMNTIPHYRDLNWIEPLDYGLIPNHKHLAKRWQDPIQHALAYTWGTTGIAYRSDLVSKVPTGWKDILEPSRLQSGKVLMIDEANEVFGATLKYMNKGVDELSISSIDLAYSILMSQRKHVRYNIEPMDENNGFVTGDIVLGMSYNGDAAFLKKHHNPNIRYVLPSEGCLLWADHWALLVGAPNRNNAHRFLDFINSPEMAAKNASFISNGTANLAAYDLLPASERHDLDIYPQNDSLAKCEFFKVKSPEISRELNQAFFMISGASEQ